MSEFETLTTALKLLQRQISLLHDRVTKLENQLSGDNK